MTVVLVLLAVGAVVWINPTAPTEAMLLQNNPEYMVPGDVERSQVGQLLADLSLDRDALTALNVTEMQAEGVLANVRSWHEDNAASLQTRSNTLAAKRVALRNLRVSIRKGEAGENHQRQLATAISEVAGAQGAYRAALGSLRSTISGSLSPSQRTTWRAIASGHGQSMPLRMLDLGTAQRLALSKAKRRFESGLGEAENANERAAAIGQWQSDLSGILTQNQQTVLTAYRGYLAESADAVATAFKTVLPKQGPA